MQKVNTIQKRIICVVLTLVMVLALAPMLETTAQAATVIDLSNLPTAPVAGQWAVTASQVTYQGTGPVTISGSNAANPRSFRVANATNITIADNTTIVSQDGAWAALSVPAGAVVTGQGAGITINSPGPIGANGIISDGALTLNGTFGNITTGGMGVRAGGAGNNLTINGTLGTITAGSQALSATGDIVINGTVGNLETTLGTGTAVSAAGNLMIGANGRIGNVTGFRNGFSATYNLTVLGTIGDINGSLDGVGVGGAGFGSTRGNINLNGTIGSNFNHGWGIIISGGTGNVYLRGRLGAVLANGGFAIRTGLGADRGNIYLQTTLTVTNTTAQVFSHQPIINIPQGFTASWRSYNLDGSVDYSLSWAHNIPGTGSRYNSYTFESRHRVVSIVATGDTPPLIPGVDLPTPTPSDGGWYFSGGNWFYYVNDERTTGWAVIDDSWYFFDASGVMQTGWVNIDGEYHFFDANGVWQYAYDPDVTPPPGNGAQPPIVGPGFYGWYFSGGNWYHYVSSVRSTGWVFDDGWYFMDANGVMQTGWIFCTTYNGWYFLNSSGLMQTGWLETGGGEWYFLQDCGALVQDEWIYIGEQWYFFDAEGVMVTGWLEQDGIYYYLTYPDGHMARGLVYINGVQYMFLGSGESLGPVVPEGEG